MESNLPSRRLVSEDVQAADVFKRTQFGGAYDERARQEVAYNHAINPSRHSAHTDFQPAPDRSANSDYWATASDAYFHDETQEHKEAAAVAGPQLEEPKQATRSKPEPAKLHQTKPSSHINGKATRTSRQHPSQPQVVLHNDQNKDQSDDQNEQVGASTGLLALMHTVKQVLAETVADFANFDSLPQPTAIEKIWSVFTSNNRWRVWLGLAGLVLAVVFIVYWLGKP